MENVRYDETVHVRGDDSTPLCGTAMMPATAPELTDDPADCWECEAIAG